MKKTKRGRFYETQCIFTAKSMSCCWCYCLLGVFPVQLTYRAVAFVVVVGGCRLLSTGTYGHSCRRAGLESRRE